MLSKDQRKLAESISFSSAGNLGNLGLALKAAAEKQTTTGNFYPKGSLKA